MDIKAFCTLFLVLLITQSSYQTGTLWLNNIRGNEDENLELIRSLDGNSFVDGRDAPIHVNVEDNIFKDNYLYLDEMYELESPGTRGGSGVTVEESNAKDGSFYIPVNLEVEGNATIWGRLNANGGIRADTFRESPDFSFEVKDDSGITTIMGETRPMGGINADNGVFVVDNDTGRTTIKGLTRPDGGIEMTGLAGLSGPVIFEVLDSDGSWSTVGQLTVEHDIILGPYEDDEDCCSTSHSIRRIINTDVGADGGDTYIQGQDAPDWGGDLILEPGYGTNNDLMETTHGSIIWGGEFSLDMTVTRWDIESGDAGDTYYSGQNSRVDGGDIAYFAGWGGDNGGDLVLHVGFDNLNNPGTIYLGGRPDDDRINFNLDITRPYLQHTADGGETTLQGQHVIPNGANNNRGGDLFFEGGVGSRNGGNINLVPGVSVNEAETQGDVILGYDDPDNNNQNLFIGRIPTNSEASLGTTYLKGQDALGDRSVGGNLVLVAGAALTSNRVGGDLFLETGRAASNGGVPGSVYVGIADEDLFIIRDTIESEDAYDTIWQAQSGDPALLGNTGGDFNFNSGDALNLNDPDTNGGDFVVMAGNGERNNGGNAIFRAGDSSLPGTLSLTAGTGTSTRGGNIWFYGSNSRDDIGADTTITAGIGGSNNGIVTVRATTFHLENIPFVHNGADGFTVRDTTGSDININADQTNIINYDDTLLLRNRYNIPFNAYGSNTDLQNFAYQQPGTGSNTNLMGVLRGTESLIRMVTNIFTSLENHHALIETCDPAIDPTCTVFN